MKAAHRIDYNGIFVLMPYGYREFILTATGGVCEGKVSRTAGGRCF